MRKKQVSITNVAERAKVSITTVSRVLNKVPTVSPDNQARVEEAIAHLKFQPNVSAQRLAKGTTNAIGLVMPGYPGIFHSFYAIEIIRGIGHACESLKLDLVFHITDGCNPLNTNAVGGVIFADIIENLKQVEAAVEAGAPCIVINNRIDELDVDYIAVDNFVGGTIAADYFISLGHKKIATITGNLNTQGGLQRFEGFKDFLQNKSISLPEEYIFQGDYSRRSARLGIEKFLTLKDPPTAIFAASDEMALEVIAAILERGFKVPQHFSVIGFDDNPACLYGPVALTTIRQPLFRMAEDSVKVLNSSITGRKKGKTKILLPPELVIRESCAALKK